MGDSPENVHALYELEKQNKNLPTEQDAARAAVL